MLKKLHILLLTVLAALCCTAIAWADYDYIDRYDVDVLPNTDDGSLTITVSLTWTALEELPYGQELKVGIPNGSIREKTALTDNIERLSFDNRYMYIYLDRAYKKNETFTFSYRWVQEYMYGLDGDTVTYDYTPGWFDDLVVERMQVRWRGGDGFVADNSCEEDGYLIWEFGPMGHGQSANIHVTVPVTTAETFDPDAQLTAADYDDGGMTADEMIGILTVVIALLIFVAALIIIVGSMTPDWGGGFGSGLDPDDWFWYTNGVHTIHVARTAPPPKGYTRTDPPKNYHTGGGSSRGGGVGRHNSGCASSCACACASSCACACACAGGGRAGCTAKDFYTYKLPHKADREDDQ